MNEEINAEISEEARVKIANLCYQKWEEFIGLDRKDQIRILNKQFVKYVGNKKNINQFNIQALQDTITREKISNDIVMIVFHQNQYKLMKINTIINIYLSNHSAIILEDMQLAVASLFCKDNSNCYVLKDTNNQQQPIRFIRLNQNTLQIEKQQNIAKICQQFKSNHYLGDIYKFMKKQHIPNIKILKICPFTNVLVKNPTINENCIKNHCNRLYFADYNALLKSQNTKNKFCPIIGCDSDYSNMNNLSCSQRVRRLVTQQSYTSQVYIQLQEQILPKPIKICNLQNCRDKQCTNSHIQQIQNSILKESLILSKNSPRKQAFSELDDQLFKDDQKGDQHFKDYQHIVKNNHRIHQHNLDQIQLDHKVKIAARCRNCKPTQYKDLVILLKQICQKQCTLCGGNLNDIKKDIIIDIKLTTKIHLKITKQQQKQKKYQDGKRLLTF